MNWENKSKMSFNLCLLIYGIFCELSMSLYGSENSRKIINSILYVSSSGFLQPLRMRAVLVSLRAKLCAFPPQQAEPETFDSHELGV